MTTIELIDTTARMIGCSPEELIESIVIVFCDRENATNQDAIIEQNVGRYKRGESDILPPYIGNFCRDRLEQMAVQH